MSRFLPVALAASALGCFGGLPDPTCVTSANCPSGTSCQAGKCVVVSVGAPAAITLSGPGDIDVNGSASAYTAVVTDAQGNPIDSTTVTWTTASAGALDITPAGLSASVIGRQVGIVTLQAAVGTSVTKSVNVTVKPASLDCLPATANVKQSSRTGTIYLAATVLRAKDSSGAVVKFVQALSWNTGLSETHSGSLGDFNFTNTGALDGNGGIPLSFDSYATSGTVHSVSLGAFGKTGSLQVTVTP
jgi:hypothetical protein